MGRIKWHKGLWETVTIPRPEGGRGGDISWELVRAKVWRRNCILCSETPFRGGSLQDPLPSFHTFISAVTPTCWVQAELGAKNSKASFLGLRVGLRVGWRVEGRDRLLMRNSHAHPRPSSSVPQRQPPTVILVSLFSIYFHISKQFLKMYQLMFFLPFPLLSLPS